MGDAPEEVREVGVNDFRMASEQQPFHLNHRLLGVSPRNSGGLQPQGQLPGPREVRELNA